MPRFHKTIGRKTRTDREQSRKMVRSGRKILCMNQDPTSTDPAYREEGLERYRVFFEESHDAFVITKKNGAILDVNQAFLDLYGYTKEDVSHMTARDFYWNPDERDKFRRLVNREGSVRDYEADNRKKDGTRITVLLTSKAQEIKEENNFIGLMGIIRDVTKQRWAERALAQRQAALEAVYELATSFKSSIKSICERIAANVGTLLQVSHVMVRQVDGDQSAIIAVSGKDGLSMTSKMLLDKPPFMLRKESRHPQQFQGSLTRFFLRMDSSHTSV